MRKYDSEFKQQALKKVFDGQSVASVSRELGVTESLVHKWKRSALDNDTNGVTGAELKENANLKKRIKELEMENEILSCSLRESSAGEVKTLYFCCDGKNKLSGARLVPSNESLGERLLCVAAANRTAANQTTVSGAIGEKLF